jgi:hypothetical protein
MNDSLEGMSRTDDRGPGAPDGWPIIDVRQVNTDPWQMDDCWHRDAYTVYTLRGTRISEEQQVGEHYSWEAHDRILSRVKRAGYTGYLEFINPAHAGGFRTLTSNEKY